MIIQVIVVTTALTCKMFQKFSSVRGEHRHLEKVLPADPSAFVSNDQAPPYQCIPDVLPSISFFRLDLHGQLFIQSLTSTPIVAIE